MFLCPTEARRLFQAVTFELSSPIPDQINPGGRPDLPRTHRCDPATLSLIAVVPAVVLVVAGQRGVDAASCDKKKKTSLWWARDKDNRLGRSFHSIFKKKTIRNVNVTPTDSSAMVRVRRYSSVLLLFNAAAERKGVFLLVPLSVVESHACMQIAYFLYTFTFSALWHFTGSFRGCQFICVHQDFYIGANKTNIMQLPSAHTWWKTAAGIEKMQIQKYNHKSKQRNRKGKKKGLQDIRQLYCV